MGRRATLALLGLLVGAGPVAAQVEVVEYYATDALGSVRVVFNANGQVVARADYQPFGELFAPVGELPPQQFTGQARDGEAGLDYFGARFYQPRHGRFTQGDPVYAGLFDPQQWNRYTYARANPLSFVDPDGRASCGVGTYHWGGQSWVPSFAGCGSSDTDRVGPGGGNGSGMSTAAWGLGGLASGGWGGGFGYTDPGRGAGGGRAGGGPGGASTTPQDGTGALCELLVCNQITNDTNETIYAKPEQDGKPYIPVEPGQSATDVDGVRVGDRIFKVRPLVRITIYGTHDDPKWRYDRFLLDRELDKVSWMGASLRRGSLQDPVGPHNYHLWTMEHRDWIDRRYLPNWARGPAR